MATKITWEDKEGIQNDASIARKNKVMDDDMNEIKQTVNNNADELIEAQENIENLQGGQETAGADIKNLRSRVSILETENTTNKSDISSLKSDNTTNKENISTLQEQVSNKVDKVEGKGLSTNDYTTEEKQKLAGLKNYDDTEIKQNIADIKEEQQTQNKNIEQNTTKNKEQDELISKLKSALINVETEEAKSLHIEDASEVPAQLKVLGNQEQETREGYNLLENTAVTQTINGITFTVNDNGTVTVNGTATAQAVLKINQTLILENGNYKLNGCPEEGSSSTYRFRLFRTNTNAVPDIGSGAFFEITENIKFNYLDIAIEEGTKISNLVFKPMIVKGTEEKLYEPYGAMPSPNYPSEVKCLGSNKNLLHMQEKSYTQLGVNVTQKESCLKLDGTTNGAQNILSGGYVDIGNFKKGKYSFKAHISGSFERQGKNDFAFYIRKKDDTSKIYGSIGGATIENSRNSFTFELTEDTDLVIQIWANASGIIFNNFEMKLKVEEGETATSYSPYRTR